MEHYKLYKLLKTINGGGTDTSDATVTPEDLMEGITAYGPEGKIEGIVQDRKGDVMSLAPNCYIVNGQDYLWTEFKPGLTITDKNSKYQPKIHFSKVAETIKLTSDKLKVGETIVGIEGTYSSDGTATAEDIISPKTAYVNGEKIVGSIIANNNTLSGGMGYETANLAASYTILDISDNYNIALLGNYNTNQFYIYKMEKNKVGAQIATISNSQFGISGTLMTAHIAQKVNSLGNLNIFAQFHVDGQLNATLCAIQINPETFEIVKKGSTTLSGKSLRGAVHCGSLAINPVYPGVVGLAFTNSSTSNNFAALIMQYNESTNAFSQKAAIGAGSPYPSNPVMTQWDKDGLVFHFGEIGGNIQSLQKIVKFSNTNFTSWTDVYNGGGYNEKVRVTVWNKNYWFRMNELRNMSNTVVRTYSEFSVNNNTLLWTYDNYLFVGHITTGVLKCFRIDTSTLDLTLCFEQSINTTFPTDAFQYYFGGIQYPASHTHRYYKDTGNTQLHFKLKDSTEIPISLKYQNKDLFNTEDATVAAGDIASGKIAYTNSGKITGTLGQSMGMSKDADEHSLAGDRVHLRANLTNDCIYRGGSYITLTLRYDKLYSLLGLTADKVKAGEELFYLTGSYTSDADATADDIVKGKTAYIKGEKITGNIEKVSYMNAGISINDISIGDTNVSFEYTFTKPMAFQNGFGMNVTQKNLASKLGLTADKIVKGNTILGVEGVADSAVDETSIESLRSLISPTNRTFFILPNGITEICDYAFYKKNNIVSSITEIPEGVTRIGKSAFHECDNLRLQKLPTTLTTIEDHAFYDCDNVLLTELPSNITKIGNSAFYYCCNMPISELPPNLTIIGEYAFYACFDLAIKEIPAGVTVINSAAFRSTGITELTILGNITKIATFAFYASDKLGKIVMPNITTVPTLGHIDAFDRTLIGTGTGLIYVPDSLVNNFKTATNWSTFADQIKPISELED